MLSIRPLEVLSKRTTNTVSCDIRLLGFIFHFNVSDAYQRISMTASILRAYVEVFLRYKARP